MRILHGEQKYALFRRMTAYWEMDATSGDETSGVGGVGGIVLPEVSAPTSGAGVVGSARVLDGTSHFLIASGDAAVFQPAGSFSARIRINSTGAITSKTFLSKWHATGNQRGYDLEASSAAAIRLIVSSGGTDTTTLTYAGLTAATGTWYDIFFGLDAKRGALWISVDAGPPQLQAYAHTINPNSTAGFCVGGLNSGQNQRFIGSVDTVAWYNGNWTMRDIRTLHLAKEFFPALQES